ncbi:alpha-N-arabinofuranosidase [Actinoplanes campanulatus]|uniref:non-reducing end alpha-L-arabinofuranosidase n=1 Tax=Actinoplanes campanulatus TaxID=113559 RepID=A0A7W5AD06_9ACTN|nr:alpha-L-arabinofuranosidase C-terminal domain-containing protein [Actinoplanes campanulatus]MBB3094033.1 alpha-N-arabinofuranosidase [Actinoplanes campanulatus]GGN33176.1 alpha-N-arabinofuranosidase [Actinoplanes campanulatus]GID38269.1 alpha-N-arabinofuranosidase [Actinoplanes campanulatus]
MTIEAVINVDLDGPKINRHVYGHFAEHLGRCVYGGFYVGEDSAVPNEGGIRLDVVEALRELGIPNLRWPGGCFADEYHWQDGIGPRSERPTMVNTHWGGVEENNHFGTHEFMALCEMLGAEPYISGNVGSGTVREMSEWVEYLTRDGDSPMARLRRANGRDEPWRVRFWGLGNETWGCGGNMSADQYAYEARRYGTYCRDHGDNRLYKIAAGANADDFTWTETLMKQIGHLGCKRVTSTAFHALSVHYYTVTGPTWDQKGSATSFDTGEYYRTMVAAARIEELLAGHAAVMDCYDPNRTVGLVLDEWGTWFDVEPGTNPGFLHQQNTLRDALVASVHFDLFHRHADRLVMANIAQTVNVLQAMILTDPDTHAMVLTPTYHVFRMNRGHQDATSLRVDLRGPLPSRPVGDATLTTVSLSASRKDGRLLISLSNLDADSPADVEIDLRGGTVHDLRALILTSAAPQDHNTPQSPSAVAPRPYDGASVTGGRLRVHLPPHSFVTVSGTL